MELINTTTCLNCNEDTVDLVENGYVIIDQDTLKVIEISEE